MLYHTVRASSIIVHLPTPSPFILLLRATERARDIERHFITNDGNPYRRYVRRRSFGFVRVPGT